MDIQRIQTILLAKTNSALSDFALRHSVGLALYSAKKYPNVASATLLMVGSHLFAATAAHCIKETDLPKIRVAYKQLGDSAHFTLIRKGMLGGLSDDPLDVGYLEIDRSVTEEVPVEFLTLDNLALEYQPEGSLAFLFGFPAALVPPDEAQRRTFRFRSLGLLTLIATDYGIPDFVNREVDIVLVYPERVTVDEQLDLQSIPNPIGISGGSMWIYDPNLANPLVGVHNARLVGIQKSWFEPKRIAIGNKVINLLRLIARDYPDVKDILNHKFGGTLAV
jgi:hypothetical protein